MNNRLLVFDGILVFIVSYLSFMNIIYSPLYLMLLSLFFTIIVLGIFLHKKIYTETDSLLKTCGNLFEAISVSYGILTLLAMFLSSMVQAVLLVILDAVFLFALMLILRIGYCVFTKYLKRTKNVLIVGAGQDGKLIADEIMQRPELGLNVVGFLDDNMNTIEDQDSSIKILGLTCDSEAVIKDNNVKIVIVAVKSRMDSDILTDLVKGIPLGVKVWRMYRFYEKITKRFLVSKMSVNWLFYDCVRRHALIYSYLKRICDIVGSIIILTVTLPLSLIAALGIKLSDFEGPIFFMQNRIGKFGKPFKMIKFRIMYQDKVEDDFDEEVTEIGSDDQRMMPFGKLLRKFHIDEIPQIINVLRGEMSIIGPRPVREEVDEENTDNIPFWKCRNWVRPGWCGWQQLKVKEPIAEERMGYDLYYIKHQNLLWDISIFVRYLCKVIVGKARGK